MTKWIIHDFIQSQTHQTYSQNCRPQGVTMQYSITSELSLTRTQQHTHKIWRRRTVDWTGGKRAHDNGFLRLKLMRAPHTSSVQHSERLIARKPTNRPTGGTAQQHQQQQLYCDNAGSVDWSLCYWLSKHRSCSVAVNQRHRILLTSLTHKHCRCIVCIRLLLLLAGATTGHRIANQRAFSLLLRRDAKGQPSLAHRTTFALCCCWLSCTPAHYT